MSYMRIAIAVLLASLLAGCASGNWRQTIYEGLRTRNQIMRAPGASPEPPLSYDQYASARKTIVREPLPE